MYFSQGRGRFFLLAHSKVSISGWSQKSYSISRISTDFGHFGYLGPLSRSIFSTCRQGFEKFLVIFLGKVVENIVSSFELFIFFGLWGGSCFASWNFPKSVILADCNFVGRPFVSYYASSVVYFFPSDNKLLNASNAVDFYWLFVD